MALRCAYGSPDAFYLGIRYQEKQKLTGMEIWVELEENLTYLWGFSYYFQTVIYGLIQFITKSLPCLFYSKRGVAYVNYKKKAS